MKEQLPSSVLQVLYPKEPPEAMDVGSLSSSPIPAVATGGKDSTLPPSGGKCEEDEASNLKRLSNKGSQVEGNDSTTTATANTTATISTATPTTCAITNPPSPSHSRDGYGCICCSENEAEEAGCLLRIFQSLKEVIWDSLICKSFELDRCMHRERHIPPSSPIPQIETAPAVGGYGRLEGEDYHHHEAVENSPVPLGKPDTEHPTLETAKVQRQQELSDRTVSFQIESNMDFFIVFHPFPPPSPCQKFLCDNTDEINLVYHCWMYPDAPYSEDYTNTEQLPMGVFEAHGVKPVHQDLKDAGVAFGRLEERYVCASAGWLRASSVC